MFVDRWLKLLKNMQINVASKFFLEFLLPI